jgi:hypothetical protein
MVRYLDTTGTRISQPQSNIHKHHIPIHNPPYHVTCMVNVNMEKERRIQIICGISLTVILGCVAIVFWPRPSLFDQRVAELVDLGYNVQGYPATFVEVQAERVGVVFEESNWQMFKQQVAATKENLGYVTVWLHREEGVLWVAASEATYYYHQTD